MDTNPTSNAATSSGLFGAAQTSNGSTKHAPKKQPRKPQRVKSAQKIKNVAEPAPQLVDPSTVYGIDLADPQAMYDLIKRCKTLPNPNINEIARNIKSTLKLVKQQVRDTAYAKGLQDGKGIGYKDGYQVGVDSVEIPEPVAPRTPETRARSIDDSGELLTSDQVAHILSNKLKEDFEAGRLTGADAKSITATLREINPAMFGVGDDTTKPDPCAVLKYVCSWAGESGDAIVKDLGGVDFVQDKLSEALKMTVRVS